MCDWGLGTIWTNIDLCCIYKIGMIQDSQAASFMVIYSVFLSIFHAFHSVSFI